MWTISLDDLTTHYTRLYTTHYTREVTRGGHYTVYTTTIVVHYTTAHYYTTVTNGH
jgi:hypothetical protein